MTEHMTEVATQQAGSRDSDSSVQPALEVYDLKKSFGPVEAVAGVSFSLMPGEVTALVGDNGAGKSTIVSMLAGVRQPDSGRIVVGGETVAFGNPFDAQMHGIATVFQDLALIDVRDVAANLHLGQEPRKLGIFVNRRAMLDEARKVIDRLQVNLPSARAAVGDLSGGQRQAVAIARAVLRGGTVMLMDEPTAALGVRESGKVDALIRQLRAEGVAVLLISHNIAGVFDIADRVIVLRHGRLVADLSVADTTHEEVVSLIVGARKEWT